MERYFSDPITINRFRSGPFGDYVQKMADMLAESGFARQTVRVQLRAADHFGRWLQRRRIHAPSVTDVEIYLVNHASTKHGEGKAVMRLLAILREERVVETPVQGPVAPVDIFLQQFASHLERERGLCRVTIEQQCRIASRFIHQRFGVKAIEWQQVTAADVISFIQKEAAARRTAMSAKNATSSTRSFLRFVRYAGLISNNLARAVPAVASWSLATVPKSLSRNQVALILKSCDRKRAAGRRDYAILLPLVRLGLRANEIARLEFSDIDWNRGMLTVVGKRGTSTQLPLPADVGRAIVAYLRHDRAAVSSCRVFLRISAPQCGLGRTAVGCIVKHAMQRAGVQSQSRGSHQFRHTLATQMLRGGASLVEIGEVLGHRDQRTTSIYAKVDFKALRPLAQAWPGGVK